MTIKTHNHTGGFTYVRAEDIAATFGNQVMIDFAKWLQNRECPQIVGVSAAYYTDFKAFMTTYKSEA